MLRKLLKSYFNFDKSTKYFWLNLNVLKYVGLSPFYKGKSYLFCKVGSTILLTIFWYFIITDTANKVMSRNWDSFMESFSLYMVHLLGLYKFSQIVS
jgi:hypothetical protein